MKVLFIDTTHPLLPSLLKENGFDVVEGFHLTKEETEKNIQAFDGIVIRSRLRIDRSFLDKCNGLRFIARVGAGMENIDVEYAEKKGIHCLHAPEGNRDAVGEHALGMLLALFNNLIRADREVREGKWKREENRGVELDGKTVGIIGFGNMGSAFAKRLSGFNVTILAYDKYKTGFGSDLIKESTLDEIKENADVLSLHIPLTAETSKMVNAELIAGFKKPFYLINTARGKVVDTVAVVNAMENGKIKGVCLDVLEYELLSFEGLGNTEFPAPLKYLMASDKAVLSPHIAGWSNESNEKLARVLVDKILYLYR